MPSNRSVMNTSCHANPTRTARAHSESGYHLYHESDGETAGLQARIRKHNPSAGIIECVHWPLFFEDVFNPDQREQIGWLKGKKVATLVASPPESRAKPVATSADLSTPSDSQIITGLTSGKF